MSIFRDEVMSNLIEHASSSLSTPDEIDNSIILLI